MAHEQVDHELKGAGKTSASQGQRIKPQDRSTAPARNTGGADGRLESTPWRGQLVTCNQGGAENWKIMSV
jgi:hypothetical protein